MKHIISSRDQKGVLEKDEIQYDEYLIALEKMGFFYIEEGKENKKRSPRDSDTSKLNIAKFAWKLLINTTKAETMYDSYQKFTHIETIKIESFFNFLAYLLGIDNFLV